MPEFRRLNQLKQWWTRIREESEKEIVIRCPYCGSDNIRHLGGDLNILWIVSDNKDSGRLILCNECGETFLEGVKLTDGQIHACDKKPG